MLMKITFCGWYTVCCLTQATYNRHIIFIDSIMMSFAVHVSTQQCLMWHSYASCGQTLCARLNWQLACQFFSANHLSYRIISSVMSISILFRDESRSLSLISVSESHASTSSWISHKISTWRWVSEAKPYYKHQMCTNSGFCLTERHSGQTGCKLIQFYNTQCQRKRTRGRSIEVPICTGAVIDWTQCEQVRTVVC